MVGSFVLECLFDFFLLFKINSDFNCLFANRMEFPSIRVHLRLLIKWILFVPNSGQSSLQRNSNDPLLHWIKDLIFCVCHKSSDEWQIKKNQKITLCFNWLNNTIVRFSIRSVIILLMELWYDHSRWDDTHSFWIWVIHLRNQLAGDQQKKSIGSSIERVDFKLIWQSHFNGMTKVFIEWSHETELILINVLLI